MADLPRVSGVKICITSGNHLWLINKSGNGSVVEVPPGELFGFNVGQFQEVPLGQGLLLMYHEGLNMVRKRNIKTPIISYIPFIFNISRQR